MPSTPFNLFMQNKNPRPRSSSRGTRTDDSDIIKAAAWAWYQHGSGSEAKIIREFDVFRPHRPPQPSRYKLEAAMRTSHTISQSQTPSPVHSPSNSLLDKFEIESISKRLDFLVESSKFHDSGAHAHVHVKKEETKNKNPKFKGFWPRHVVMCGAKEDVVDTTAFRRPARLVPLVRLATNSKPTGQP